MPAIRTIYHRLAVEIWNGAHDLRAHATGDSGYTTETVIAIVALAAIALTVTGLLTNQIMAKAKSLNLGG